MHATERVQNISFDDFCSVLQFLRIFSLMQVGFAFLLFAVCLPIREKGNKRANKQQDDIFPDIEINAKFTYFMRISEKYSRLGRVFRVRCAAKLNCI